MIGFSIFIGISNFYKSQSEIFRSDVVDLSLDMMNSYISSYIINLVDTCKQCDYVTVGLDVENRTAGYFYKINFTDNKLDITAPFTDKQSLSSVHNIDSSIVSNGEASSAETINLTFNRAKNELRIQ